VGEKQQGKVLTTLRELGSLFEFGGEITPFLEVLLAFLEDLVPIMTEVNTSWDNLASSMPTASGNIASAEEVAEDATNTIMDNADQINAQLGDLLADDGNGDTKKVLEEVMHRAEQIQMSLQFQDISSQHLQQASRIVEAINNRLENLFNALQNLAEHNELVKTVFEKQPAEKTEEIDLVDTIHQKDAISQADIDAMFGGQ
jgi:hypothetical protein